MTPTLWTENRGLIWITQVPSDTELARIHACTVSHVAYRTTLWHVRALWTVLVLRANVADDAVHGISNVGAIVTVVAWVTVTLVIMKIEEL